MNRFQRNTVCCLVALAMNLASSGYLCGQEVLPSGDYDITIYLSDIGTVGNGVELTNPIQNHYGVGGRGTLYVWVDPGEIVLEGLSLRARTVVPDVISFIEPPSVFNPDIVLSNQGNADSGFDRWDDTGGSPEWYYIVDPHPELSDTFSSVAGIYSRSTGIHPGLDGTNSMLDPLYDTDAGAFLFAQIDYDVIGLGSTPLYLEIGKNGIISEIIGGHSSQIDVFFGDGEFLPSDALNAWSQRLIPSTLPDAFINVLPEELGTGSESVPEPSGLMLFAMGVAALLSSHLTRRCRHRSKA